MVLEYGGEPGRQHDEAARLKHLRDETLWCAPSFEAFLYRFWLENHLWFALTRRRRRMLSDDELAYLHYYRA
jgi:hypothetical protein